jgi:hypothetical protein
VIAVHRLVRRNFVNAVAGGKIASLLHCVCHRRSTKLTNRQVGGIIKEKLLDLSAEAQGEPTRHFFGREILAA